MNKKILIINQQHTDNIGDQIIGKVMKELFKEYDVQFEPYIVDEIYKEYKRTIIFKIFNKIRLGIYYNDFFYYKVIKKVMKNRKFDIAIIGGGELISGNLEFNSSFKAWIRFLSRSKIPIVVAGVSGNEVAKRIGKRYKKSLEKCKKIYVRDLETKRICNDIYNVNATYCPDFAFALNIDNNEKQEMITTQVYYYPYIDKKYIDMTKEQYFEYIYKIIQDNVAEEKVVLSYSNGEDKISTKEFKEYIYKTKNIDFDIVNLENSEKLIRFISKTKLIISSRMHSMILGKIANTKLVPVVTKDKIKIFREEWVNENVKNREIKDSIIKMVNEIKEIM